MPTHIQRRVAGAQCSKQLETCKKDSTCAKLHQTVEAAVKAQHEAHHKHQQQQQSGDNKNFLKGGRRELLKKEEKGSAGQGTGECMRACELLLASFS